MSPNHETYEWYGENVNNLDETSYPIARRIGRMVIIIYAIFIVALMILRVFYRKSISRGKPFLASLLDTLCEIPSLLEIGPWGRDNGIQRALETSMAETGLTDFGTDDTTGCKASMPVLQADRTGFIQRYLITRNVGRRRSGAIYSPLGYALCGNVLHKRMCQRLRHIDFMKRHPQIRHVSIHRPIFVIGFPRTGTTLLHELLGLHSKARMHYTWEQMEHVPTTHEETISAQRINRQRRYAENKPHFERILKVMGSNIQKIHRIGYDEPEECTTPCAMELPWAIPEIPLMVHAMPELLPLGCGLAFDYYKEYLQLLTWQAAGDMPSQHISSLSAEKGIDLKTPEGAKALGCDLTWVLKCPFHLPYLDELFAAFPDATVVWTHRDPVECIASACSLYETLAEVGSDSWTVDKAAIGESVLKYTEICLNRAEESIAKLNQATTEKSDQRKRNSIIHVRYADNIKKPQDVCTGILKQAEVLTDGPASQEYCTKVEQYMAASKAKRAKEEALVKGTSVAKKQGDEHVLHAYSLEEYGLSVEKVRAMFKSYTDKYNLVAGKQQT